MAESHWFYAKGQQQLGPIGSARLKQLAAAGELSPDDLVWREGMAAWAPAARVAGLFNGHDSDSQVVVRQPAALEAMQAVPVEASPSDKPTKVFPRPGNPAKALLRLQIGVWVCCLAVMLIAACIFTRSIGSEDAGQRTSAAMLFIAFALAAYISARSAEKLLELVLSYLDARRSE